ncbi:lysoplasmalogenase [Kribbella turkmenica]|uniref:Lysoplasmalogenase n=1 Tax=Kribbella turkmenica TaxID=2530375 RepID=A0A4R4X8G9_9ACTN|nr:lysoplasmalogenase family protein [Kribbella turkmenica]TDD26770.1 lysoplasmalogenase [Kribbella turkmenica]
MSLTSLSTTRRRLTGYWASATIHLIAVAFDLRVLRMASKAALMPALASWVRAQQGPPLLVAALLASAVGDLLMEVDLILPAMAMFAAAHACYIAEFTQGTSRRSLVIPAAYGVLGLATMVALWPGLGSYRAPVTAYAIMLLATAVTSLWYGGRAGLGGALFLASDTLIAARLAGHDFPLRAFLLKTAYGTGQYQIALGLTGPTAILRRSGGCPLEA